MIQYTIHEGETDKSGSIMFFLGTSPKPYVVDFDHPNIEAVKAEILSDNPDEARLISLSAPINALREALTDEVIANYLPEGKLVVTTSGITYDGEPVHSVLAEIVLNVIRNGLDVMPWIKFIQNVYRNPNTVARDELFLFLQSGNLPITPDGCFLAYKRVRADYHDCRTGSFDNSVGQTLEMPRTEVDPDRQRTCAVGFHFCSFEYLAHFSGARIMQVKVNPADVVAIPADYSNTKGRTWKYTVVGEVDSSEVEALDARYATEPYADVDDEYYDDEYDEYADNYGGEWDDEVEVDETDDIDSSDSLLTRIEEIINMYWDGA